MNKTNTYSSPKNASRNLPVTVVCFSHLRWDFVFQRPQHLLTRMAKETKVFYIEEPMFDSTYSYYSFSERAGGPIVVVPHLPAGRSSEEYTAMQKELLDDFLAQQLDGDILFWYYTPMALPFSRHFKPAVTVFDCMDELSAFKFAPPEIKELEKEVLQKADVVFTGGRSLYEAKKTQHHNIHFFPSSIDKEHFAKARLTTEEPADQVNIPFPRLGFYGVLDERFDIELIKEAADQRPDWQFVLIGPVVKIDPATLPTNSNIHYLGGKSYNELPHYLSGWDIALIPFALNESTKFISPTKTPEYLAGGKPVISAPIKDVVESYGAKNLVHIAANAEQLIGRAEAELAVKDKTGWLEQVDICLADISWDKTVEGMVKEIKKIIEKQQNVTTVTKKDKAYV